MSLCTSFFSQCSVDQKRKGRRLTTSRAGTVAPASIASRRMCCASLRPPVAVNPVSPEKLFSRIFFPSARIMRDEISSDLGRSTSCDFEKLTADESRCSYKSMGSYQPSQRAAVRKQFELTKEFLYEFIQKIGTNSRLIRQSHTLRQQFNDSQNTRIAQQFEARSPFNVCSNINNLPSHSRDQ